MGYMINARLDQGAPVLTMVDITTGKECLHWRADSQDSDHSWRALFKRLMLLSCAGRLSLTERAHTPTLGTECLACTQCVEPLSFSENMDAVRVADKNKSTPRLKYPEI